MKTITPQDLRALTDVNANVTDRVESLMRLAHWERGKYDDLEPVIAGLLRDPSALVRGGAIKTLLGWGRDKYIEAAIEILRTDRDEDPAARTDASFALATYATDTDQHRDRILQALVSALKTDPDWRVQEECYIQLLRLIAPDRKHRPSGYEVFDRDRDVDWDLLSSCS